MTNRLLPATRGSVVATPNVAPMIDVMLVLLIIFMLVTPALSGAVRLPEGVTAAPRPEDVRDRTLTIDASGAYTLSSVPIARDDLPSALRRFVAENPLDHVLYLRADQRLDYVAVQSAIDVARANGIRVVGLVTEVAAPTRLESR